jgi:hypothetical protein
LKSKKLFFPNSTIVPSKSMAILMLLKLIIQAALNVANLIISANQLKFIIILLPLLPK